MSLGNSDHPSGITLHSIPSRRGHGLCPSIWAPRNTQSDSILLRRMSRAPSSFQAHTLRHGPQVRIFAISSRSLPHRLAQLFLGVDCGIVCPITDSRHGFGDPWCLSIPSYSSPLPSAPSKPYAVVRWISLGCIQQGLSPIGIAAGPMKVPFVGSSQVPLTGLSFLANSRLSRFYLLNSQRGLRSMLDKPGK